MHSNQKQFGKVIKILRNKANLTQQELAHRVELTQAAVVLIEQGKRGVSTDTIEKLAVALGISPECLGIFVFRQLSRSKEIAELSRSLRELVACLVELR